MGKGLIDSILDSIFDAEWIGKKGEKLTQRELNLLKLFGRDGKVLRNVYIPKSDGGTSEIDVLFITQKGIFVIESKNYSGWVFGDEQAMYWTVTLQNGQKNRLYNPIRQNRTHIKRLSEYLGNEIRMFSLIVFSERCELKKITLASSDVTVVKRDDLYAAVRKIWEASEDCLTQQQTEEIYTHLQKLTNADESVKQAHIDDIRSKYEPKADGKICPQCGGTLVLRNGKYGSFYGCKNYPKCRYTSQA